MPSWGHTVFYLPPLHCHISQNHDCKTYRYEIFSTFYFCLRWNKAHYLALVDSLENKMVKIKFTEGGEQGQSLFARGVVQTTVPSGKPKPAVLSPKRRRGSPVPSGRAPAWGSTGASLGDAGRAPGKQHLAGEVCAVSASRHKPSSEAAALKEDCAVIDF